MHVTNQITLQQSLTSKLNLIFKVNKTTDKYFTLDTWDIKNEERMEKLL